MQVISNLLDVKECMCNMHHIELILKWQVGTEWIAVCM